MALVLFRFRLVTPIHHWAEFGLKAATGAAQTESLTLGSNKTPTKKKPVQWAGALCLDAAPVNCLDATPVNSPTPVRRMRHSATI